jgi:predicted O-methyltransferase YrrM
MTWTDIPGWLSVPEGDALRMLAVGKRVLEFGSYKGRSTICMAEVAQSIDAVDWHRGDPGTGPADTLGEFVANLAACGVDHRVRAIVCPIDECRPRLAPWPYDLAFVDDDHDDAERSTRIALRHLKPGGVIAWHDWDYGGVRDAVHALGLTPLAVVGGLAWAAVPGGSAS